MTYEALLVLSFGGPEGPADVRPFLENVTRGRGVPPERLDAVEEHYRHFGGVSPLNARNRELAAALREFKRALVHHHGRWAEGEADEVAALLTRASALLNGTAGSEQPPISTTQPD